MGAVEVGGAHLPAVMTSFVNRRHELAEIGNALSASRLVTLTGPGGVGKSRLALRAAQVQQSVFADGVWWVGLADVGEPSLLASTVGEALGVKDPTGRGADVVLYDYLSDMQALLVLDNCEHLARACAQLVSGAVNAAPELRVIATSRDALDVGGEHVIPVQPMPVRRSPGSGQVGESDVVDLFAERASAVVPGFEITADNREAVARLCQRLDGLPLAIELAAGRLRVLSPGQMLSRMREDFALLSGGRASQAPRHHQTMQAAVEWSYNLCSEQEKCLWRRISVFSGSFDLQAAQAVCSDGDVPAEAVATGLEGLAGHSILIREASGLGTRYRLLETIRAAGRQRLRETGLETDLRMRHRDHFLNLVERAESDWFGPGQLAWLQRVRTDLTNLHAAMEFCLSTPGETQSGTRMAGLLWFYWQGCGAMAEGAFWLDRFLTADPEPSSDRVRVLWVREWIAQTQGDTSKALRLMRQCEREADSAGDDQSVPYAWQFGGLVEVFTGGNQARGREMMGKMVMRHRAAQRWDSARVLGLMLASLVLSVTGETSQAMALAGECRALCEAHGERWALSHVLQLLGEIERLQGDHRTARVHVRQGLVISREFDNTLMIALGMETLGWLAASLGEFEHGARVLGAAAQIWRPIGTPLLGFGGLYAARRKYEARLREVLGEDGFGTAYASGVRMSAEAAISYALEEDERV